VKYEQNLSTNECICILPVSFTLHCSLLGDRQGGRVEQFFELENVNAFFLEAAFVFVFIKKLARFKKYII